MDDIKHDPDPLLTSMMNLMWRYDKDPSADALVDVLNEAAAEIKRLRQELDAISLALDECKADNERSLGKVEDLQTILTKELPIILVGEDGEQYVLRRNS